MRSTDTKRASSVDRSVPSSRAGGQDEKSPPRELVLSVSSINLSSSERHANYGGVADKSLSLYTRDAHGNVYTNLNIQETSDSNSHLGPAVATATQHQIHITSDHVKYINLFSILCCWCFPITGVLSIMFARKTRRYYNANEMIRAKWYLNRAEWMLLLTFFFGLTLIATGFALWEVFWFNSRQISSHGVFHTS